VYPDSPHPQPETTIPAPHSPYEQGKYEEEQLVTAFADTHHLTHCIARLGNVYGDIQNRGVVGYLFQSLVTHTSFAVNGTGDQTRDYIFVDDVASALAALATTPLPSPTSLSRSVPALRDKRSPARTTLPSMRNNP
jgi:UDP-glucose 4-epimerase